MLTSVEVSRGGVADVLATQVPCFIPDAAATLVPDGPPQSCVDGFTVAQASYPQLREQAAARGPDGWLLQSLRALIPDSSVCQELRTSNASRSAAASGVFIQTKDRRGALPRYNRSTGPTGTKRRAVLHQHRQRAPGARWRGSLQGVVQQQPEPRRVSGWTRSPITGTLTTGKWHENRDGEGQRLPGSRHARPAR